MAKGLLQQSLGQRPRNAGNTLAKPGCFPLCTKGVALGYDKLAFGQKHPSQKRNFKKRNRGLRRRLLAYLAACDNASLFTPILYTEDVRQADSCKNRVSKRSVQRLLGETYCLCAVLHDLATAEAYERELGNSKVA